MTNEIGVGTLVEVIVTNELLQGKIGYVIYADIYPKEMESWYSVILFDTKHASTPLDFAARELRVLP